MSSIEKGMAIMRGPDGKTVCMETTVINSRARLASTLIAATMASNVLKEAMGDDGVERINPRKIASLACDMANALYTEIEERDWIRHVPPPAEAEELTSF